MYRAALLAVLLVLAGCQAPTAAPSGPDVTPTATPDDAAAAQSTATSPATETPAPTETQPADPSSDRLGWENGVWHNETLAVNNTDGLNASERALLVNRSIARIEYVRQREFTETVPVSVISRSAYANRSQGNTSEGVRRFDNGKFEALFLIGERNDSITQQDQALSQSVLGYYSPARDEIVVVADSVTPQLDGEGTLAHELVHALQDQQFDLRNHSARTRDAYQGSNGIVEGDASYVQQRYMARCGESWSCLDRPESGSGGGGGGDRHFGLNFLMYFPYSDGPGFVEHRQRIGGWDAVDAAFADRPDGATEVIYPGRYPEWEPADVTLSDRSTGDWERVRPPGRPDYAVVGQSAIASSLAYTATDEYNSTSVVAGRDIINFEPDGGINQSDPYNYDLPATRGWAGGRMYVYENGDRTGYVWRTRWENASEAAEFASTWELLVQHWGGERVGENTWEIAENSPFTDAVRIEQSGATVTVVNAPSQAALDEVHDA